MRSKKIEAYKEGLNLTKRQREIIVGLLLGDGHLETQNSRTYRLKVEHSIKQKDYVDWLYRQFSDWVRQEPKLKERIVGGKRLDSYWFTTYSSGSLRFYAQQFYLMRKKIIPNAIGKLLSPLTLAIWFMDDGSWKSDHHRTYIIHTLGYDKRELLLVQKALLKKFGIATNLHRQYNGLRLYILSNSSDRFKRLIESYVIPSMKYKLG